ncbi:class A beta-lactamase-related serine hydrolase [Alteromonas sediminis]|uniref:Class A beta-lactamase-related serine hydrolase n=1 Tax=Alteromonas sediminis TaxID=2259342 RepID=A0A3N5YBQ3_9ALTE|nr:serine hydrolase domain-containing protein [Alteromonas sediminis]RPJ66495.1 class A beta-lactamase-related serine hydrolase [Alteromonas sediminis]
MQILKNKALWITSFLIIGLCQAALAQQLAPTATPEEAKITHWQMPAIGRGFMEIPELETAYINPQPTAHDDGIEVGKLSDYVNDTSAVIRLAKEMAEGQHGSYDSLLISQNGKLLFESYFKRGRIDLPHPQSSAGKAYIGLTLGRAIQKGYLSMSDLDKPIVHFFDQLQPEKFVEGVETITLRKALTMRGGLQISDEAREALNTRTDLKGQAFVQYLFEHTAPVTPASQAFSYGNYNPSLVLHVVDALVPGSVWAFIENELMAKMGIKNYDLSRNSASRLPDQWSITSRAMVKIGHLVRNKGVWNNEQLIPSAFISQTIDRVVLTGDESIFGGGKSVSNQGYGYFWWVTDIEFNGKHYYATSAQGGGGMYILRINELDLQIVTTAHHRNDATQQVIAEHLLPVFVKATRR